MENQKTKVKGLDVLLQVLIAIFSLAWIGLYVTYLATTKNGLHETGYMKEMFWYGYFHSTRTFPELVQMFVIGLVFSIVVIVFVVVLSRKVTATRVRGLFTFGFIILMIQFYNYLCELPVYIRSGALYRYRQYYYLSDFSKYDITVMVLTLLMLCFAMARQKQSGLFIGQTICLVLMVISDTMGIVSISKVYEQVFPNVLYVFDFFAMWCFYLMIALLSIWLRRRNYFRMQEECTVTECPYGKGLYVPEDVVPVTTNVPVIIGDKLSDMREEWGEPEKSERPGTENVTIEQETTVVSIPEEMTKTVILPTTENKDVQVVLESMEPEKEEIPVIQEEIPVIQEEVSVIEEEVPVAPEEKVRRCTNCGSLLEEGDIFCCECGTKVME